jgi:benzoate 4-monooxygenase
MGHSNGFSKSKFYEIFDWHSQSVFTTRDRATHARKRKWLSTTFSSRSIGHLESFVTAALQAYGRQMENIIDGKAAGKYVFPINEDTSVRKSANEGVLDAIVWNAFLAFHIIGDLVSGAFQ